MTNKEFQTKILAKLQELTERISQLEKNSHPQGALVDAELTEGLRRLARGEMPGYVHRTPDDFRHRKIC